LRVRERCADLLGEPRRKGGARNDCPRSSRRSACGSLSLNRPRVTHLAVRRLQRLVEVIQIEVAVNAPRHVIGRNVSVERGICGYRAPRRICRSQRSSCDRHQDNERPANGASLKIGSRAPNRIAPRLLASIRARISQHSGWHGACFLVHLPHLSGKDK
jgi:hypothetical protein